MCLTFATPVWEHAHSHTVWALPSPTQGVYKRFQGHKTEIIPLPCQLQAVQEEKGKSPFCIGGVYKWEW